MGKSQNLWLPLPRAICGSKVQQAGTKNWQAQRSLEALLGSCESLSGQEPMGGGVPGSAQKENSQIHFLPPDPAILFPHGHKNILFFLRVKRPSIYWVPVTCQALSKASAVDYAN